MHAQARGNGTHQKLVRHGHAARHVLFENLHGVVPEPLVLEHGLLVVVLVLIVVIVVIVLAVVSAGRRAFPTRVRVLRIVVIVVVLNAAGRCPDRVVIVVLLVLVVRSSGRSDNRVVVLHSFLDVPTRRYEIPRSSPLAKRARSSRDETALRALNLQRERSANLSKTALNSELNQRLNSS